ncbi:MAG: histidine kinase dimerization/phospho-acceptor domain-containing protein, partial [Pseudobdellovibrionaceae bacterium]
MSISNEQLAKVLLEGSLDCVFVLGYVRNAQNEVEDFKIVEVNPNVFKLTKMKKEDLLGKNLCELFPFVKARPFFKRYKEAIQFHRPLDREFPISELGPRVTWLKHQFIPLENDAILAWRDISIQKDVELEHRQRSEALENLSANAPGVLYNFTLRFDGTSQISFFGNNGHNHYDTASRGNWIVEFALAKLAADKTSTFYESILTSAKNLSPCHWVGTFKMESGEEHWIQCKSLPRKQDNDDIKWYGIAIDFTDQFKTARELDTQKARAAASSKMAALGEMASSIAHEVNTPLTVIKLRLEQAISGIQKSEVDSKKMLENLEKLNTMTDRVAKIIKSL